MALENKLGDMTREPDIKWAATLALIALVVAILFVPARDTDKTMRVYSEAAVSVEGGR